MAADDGIYPSWDSIEASVLALCDQLAAAGYTAENGARIFGVARGGLIPAVLVSHRLDVPFAGSIHHQTRDSAGPGERGLWDWESLPPMSRDVVVEDIVDTGKTARELKLIPMFANAPIAALYAKPRGKPLASYFVEEVEQDVWVYFPWEGKR